MTIQDPNALYQFLLQQQVAEAYLENVVLTDDVGVKLALVRGNNREGFPNQSNGLMGPGSISFPAHPS